MASQHALPPNVDLAAKDVPQLTDAYRKAHKTYMLASGLLASWELIGITLDTKEKWGIELKSPKAVPLILFTLVLYSGYKLVVEWLQCDAERRRNRVAKIDYMIAHTIALGAIGIAVVQYLSKTQLVDLLGRHFYPPEQLISVEQILFLGVIVSVGVTVGGIKAWRNFGRTKRTVTILSVPSSIYLVLTLIGTVTTYQGYLSVLAALALGIMLAWLSHLLLSRIHASDRK